MSGATSLFPRHHSPLRMLKNFLLGKRVLCGWLASHRHYLGGTFWIRHHNLSTLQWLSEQSPSILIGQSSSRWYAWTHVQDRVLLDWMQTKSLHLTLLPMVGWSGACQKLNICPLYFGKITPLIIQLFEIWCQVAALYKLVDGSAALKLGLDGILDGMAEYPHTMAPHWVPISLLWVLLSPSLGDGLSTGPMALQINNSAMAAFICRSDVYSQWM